MKVRLFSNGTASISRHTVDVTPLPRNNYLLPLDPDQVQLETLRSTVPLEVSVEKIATVQKGDVRYEGDLLRMTDNTATLLLADGKVTIRNYDLIEERNGLLVRAPAATNDVSLSYVTSGLSAQVVHRLDIGTSILTSEILVTNNGLVDLEDASIEYQVSEDTGYPMLRTQAMYSEESAPSRQSASGTIYSVPGTHDLPAGYRVRIPLIQEQVEMREEYMVQAPNGRSNAVYTVFLTSPVDLPAGQVLVYQGGDLLATSSLPMVGAGQEQAVSVQKVPFIFAKGRIDVRQKERERTVTLAGTISNSSSEDAPVTLTYPVGDGEVTPFVPKIAGSVAWEYVVRASGSVSYSHTFTVKG